jgi:hypothetical protein
MTQSLTPDISRALNRLRTLNEGACQGDDDEEPVFICAVGWGSGSTLLQRILMTDSNLLIWGEPYGRMGLVSHLVEAISSVSESWPQSSWFKSSRVDAHEQWVANWYPDPAFLIRALRSLFIELFAAPAREKGAKRWGVKEVRWSANEARLLQELFPKSSFVVLVRDPAACYASAKSLTKFARHDEPIRSTKEFADHWARVGLSWQADSSPSRILIRYEDMIRPDFDFSRIAETLHLNLTPDQALHHKKGARSNRNETTFLERATLRWRTGAARKLYGY